MKERVLKEYFEDKISSKLLSVDLNGSFERVSHDTFEINIERMELGSEFEVEQKHVEKILTEALNGNLTYDNLKTIASGLMFSEYFTWDPETEIGNRIATIILELDNTEIHFPFSTENLKLWKEYLESGVHKLKIK